MDYTPDCYADEAADLLTGRMAEPIRQSLSAVMFLIKIDAET